MKRIEVVITILMIAVTFPSCGRNLIIPEERLAAIQEAGDAYGLTFETVYEMPDMPAGAVFVFESDEFKKSVTEAYECYFDHDTLMDIRAFKYAYNGSSFIHIDKERRIIVAQKFPGFRAHHETNDIMYKFYSQTTPEQKNNAILYLEHSYYMFQKLLEQHSIDTQATYDYIKEAMEDPESPLFTYNKDMTPEELDSMFYASIYETDIINAMIYGRNLDPVTVGNRYDRSEIPEEAWIIFNIPDHYLYGRAYPRQHEIICKDLKFLLDAYYGNPCGNDDDYEKGKQHHFKTSDTSW